MLRQNWQGSAVRWILRQGPMSLALTVGGMASITVAAFLLAAALGFLVLGIGLITLENLTRQDRP